MNMAKMAHVDMVMDMVIGLVPFVFCGLMLILYTHNLILKI